MQLIMINEPTSIIAAFANGWLCHAILRFGKHVQRPASERRAIESSKC
jgi:hypothetical protein